VISNLLMFLTGVSYDIPGVFVDSTRRAVNTPLWSLPSELWLYALLFLIFRVGGRRSGMLLFLGAIALSIAWAMTSLVGVNEVAVGPLSSSQFSRLGSFFLCGALLAVCRARIENHAVAIGAAALLGLILIRTTLPFETLFHSLALATVVVAAGSSRVVAWFSKGGDASYGMYIFAWPVQQFSRLLIDSFWVSMFAAFVITTALGYATWHTFERRAMAHRARLAENLHKIAASVTHRPGAVK
jgi:peptidoglycan/LPS O-acetylase OafA/YrhL